MFLTSGTEGSLRLPNVDAVDVVITHDVVDCFAPSSKVERDMAQRLERGALPMSLPVVRFWVPLGAVFSEKYHVSLLSIL